MAADPGNRYQHLLQPIRDLSKVWNIEIADELEKYIEEVASFSFQTAGGSRRLNFAEAALLIQGSTTIYSRKVEQLYALVYQALDQLALNKAKKDGEAEAQVKKKADAVPGGLSAQIPDTDELLTIDHLVKKGRNLLLDDAALRRQEQRQALNRRVPIFLLPQDRSDSKQEFRISGCKVHRSGAYLIQESDTRLLEEFLSREGPVQCTPLAPPPPSEVQELDEQLQVLLRGIEESEMPNLGPPEPSPVPPDEMLNEATDFAAADESCIGSPLQSLLREPEPRQVEPDVSPEDPWALLDEDMQVGNDVPPEAGNCARRFGTKGLLSKGDGLPDPGSWGPLTDAELWRPGGAADGLSSLLAAGHPVESLFRVVGTFLRNGGRTETERAGFSAAWLEFEDLFQAAASKRKKENAGAGSSFKANRGTAAEGPAPQTPPRAGFNFGGCDSDDERGDVFTPPRPFSPPIGGNVGSLNDDGPLDEQRQQVARLEGLIEDAQSQYESSVRSQLHRMQGGADANSQKYPELYENVRKWQEQLAPVLKEFESHPEFDINNSGAKLLGKMVALDKGDGEHGVDRSGKAIPFSRLVYGQPRWEVCRRFLTCLILTNQGNTEIVCDDDCDRIDNFSVKLLKAEKPHLTLYPEEEPKPIDMSPAQALDASVRRVSTPLRRGSKRSRESFEEQP